MKIIFVQNFLLDSTGSPSEDYLYPHLGLISLIAEIEKSRHVPFLYDPMLQLHRGRLTLDSSLYDSVASQLLKTEPDAIGFTALGCNFVAVVKIARQIKQQRPKTIVLLGGPHPTVLESAIMNRFADFDLLVRGEAEQTIVPLLDALDSGDNLSALPGITHREGSYVHRSIDAGVMDVDRLPMAAFHFYPINELGMRSMRVEAGRGCPFHCTFCSTATFFGRKYRVKGAQKLVDELRSINSAYNIADFSLQHDLFTVNRRKVLEFCEEVRQCGFSWTCSARIDCVDSELLREMARAGCRGIYFGVETGSSRLQEVVKKRLDVNLLIPTLTHAKMLGIDVTTSFITGFPEETVSDLEATLECLDRCHRISPTTTRLQLHLLTPEPGTALYEEKRNHLLYDGHITDFNFPVLDADESALLQGNPDIFMNHHFYATKLPRKTFVGITSIFPYLVALGGALLRAVLECLEVTVSTLLFTMLSRCEGDNITHQKVFNQLLLLINERGTDRTVIRQLVKFAFAHVHARQSERSKNMQFAGNGWERIMSFPNSATLFRNTFDIPSVLDRIHKGAESWRSISARPTTYNFVVYREHAGSESKTLRVSENVAVVLDLLKKPRPKGWILREFPGADARAVAVAIEDLFKRGVLRYRASGNRNAPCSHHRIGQNALLGGDHQTRPCHWRALRRNHSSLRSPQQKPSRRQGYIN
jgi:radical SAM superfamily enzyme YgiQ (UPF0313 family)